MPNFAKINGKILLLASGVALGVYIPPIIICKQLKKAGIDTEFFVIENLIIDDKIENILKNKFAFHIDFKIALTGQKLSAVSDYGIDRYKVQSLYVYWDEIKISKIIVFSGFWLSIVDEYIKKRNRVISVDLCHLDCSISASWKKHKELIKIYNNIWFFDFKHSKVCYFLQVSRDEIMNFDERDKRCIIHGGGWGMGTYKDKIRELDENGINLDVINYQPHEIYTRNKSFRNFLISPNWKAWEKKDNEYIFPPFFEFKQPCFVEINNNLDYPKVYDLIRQAAAIISKPGGATLIDSFSSATPIILLDPFGEYEKSNADLWKKLGFGIDYDKWAEMGYTSDILYTMHINIKNALHRSINFIDLFI